jgi:7,8-dihydroneopterin aldolase/epimerase/oxygenase
MDQIIISDLEVHYRVGVPDEERTLPQRLLISVTIDHSFGSAQDSDDLSQTIDYGAITTQLNHFGNNKEWKLIERLANDIAQWILTDFQARQVTVEVKKFIIPNAKHVAVRLTRSQSSASQT